MGRVETGMPGHLHHVIFSQAIGKPTGQTSPSEIMKLAFLDTASGKNREKLTAQVVDRFIGLAVIPLALRPHLEDMCISFRWDKDIGMTFRLSRLMFRQKLDNLVGQG